MIFRENVFSIINFIFSLLTYSHSNIDYLLTKWLNGLNYSYIQSH